MSNEEWARTAVREMLVKLKELAVAELQCAGLVHMAAAARLKRWHP